MIKTYRIKPIESILSKCEELGYQHDYDNDGRSFCVWKKKEEIILDKFYIRTTMIQKMGNGVKYQFEVKTPEECVITLMLCIDDRFFYRLWMLEDDFLSIEDFSL